MSGLKFQSVALKVEFALLALLIVSTTFWRWLNIPTLAVDPDEVFLIGSVDRAATGDRIYLDHIDGHMPAIHRLYRPILAAIGERPDVLVLFRRAQFPIMLLFLGSLLFAAWRLAGTRGALWAAGLWSSFPFLASLQTQVRYDFPAAIPVFLAAGILLKREKVETSNQLWIVAGALAGLAAIIHVTAPFYLAAFGLWSLLSGGSDSLRRTLARALLCGAVAVATWLALMTIALRFRLLEGLVGLLRAFVFDRVYQTEIGGSSGFFLPRLFQADPLPWLALGFAVVIGHYQAASARRRTPNLLLSLLLFDFGIIAVATRLPDYPQRYVPSLVGGALLGGVTIAHWLETPRFQWSRVRALQGPAIALALAAWTTAALFVSSAYRVAEPQHAGTLPVDAVASPDGGPARIEVESLLSWWSAVGRDLSPFHPRGPAELEAVERFILGYSARGDAVYTDWMNPPFRSLPVPQHHGLMIVVFEDSEILRRDPAAVRAYQHYNPAYKPEKPSLIGVFERSRTKIIMLDGAVGERLRRDPVFKRWLVDRYDIWMEPRFLNAFAVLREGGMPSATGVSSP